MLQAFVLGLVYNSHALLHAGDNFGALRRSPAVFPTIPGLKVVASGVAASCNAGAFASQVVLLVGHNGSKAPQQLIKPLADACELKLLVRSLCCTWDFAGLP